MSSEHRPPVLRDARSADAPRLAEIDRVCFPKYAYSTQLILRFMELGLPCVVAVDGVTGDTVGFAMVMAEREEGTGMLVTIDVVPGQRRQGLGRTMLAWCARALLDHEPAMGSMWLTVAKGNEGARRFYAEMGFREADTVEGYYRDDDAVVMVHLDLPSLVGEGSP